MTISERVEAWVRRRYADKGMEFTGYDKTLVFFWVRVFPKIILIPVLFIVLKYYFISYMLAKQGFEYTVIFIAILLVLRPLVVSAITDSFRLRPV